MQLTLIWVVVLAGAAALIFWLGGSWLIDFMTTNVPVREMAENYLIWVALTPLFGVLAFQMDGIFVGATWSRDMRNMMLISIALYLTAYEILFPLLGNHGLWLALEIFLGARGFSHCGVSAAYARRKPSVRPDPTDKRRLRRPPPPPPRHPARSPRLPGES
ncbi:MATE family efflux transporter [Breoghania sp.]|uniref:MATE family efflux transporter n=1 Tax=Breoghania sp. TaxID=2065378 RepID=UPI0032049CE7